MSRAASKRSKSPDSLPAPLGARASCPTVPQLSYSVESFARAMTLPRATVYQLIEAGELATFKIGRRRLIAAQDAAEFLDRARAGGMARTLEQMAAPRPGIAA